MKTKQILISFCAGAACAVLILGTIVCKQSTAYSILKSNYSELKKITAADKVISDNRIKEQEGIIAEKDKRIQQILAGANQPTPEEIEKDKTIGALNAQLAKSKTDAEKVPVLTALVDSWKYKYDGSEARRKAELLSLNTEWEGKFAAQVKITDEWKDKYNKEHLLRLKCEGLLGVAEHRISLGKFWTTVETVALLGAAGYAGYKLLKK